MRQSRRKRSSLVRWRAPSQSPLTRVDPNRTLAESALDALASAMAVFLLCDLWRLAVGPLPGVPPLDLPWQRLAASA